MQTSHALLGCSMLVLCHMGCDLTTDRVAPGYYGEMTRDCVAAAGSGAAGAVHMMKPTASSSAGNAGAAIKAVETTSPAMSCNMTGQWLVTVHKTTDALGNLQYIHNYLYYEIEQTGDTFTVTKSLQCGMDAVGGGAFAVSVDYSEAAAAVMAHVSHNGRKGRSVSASAGCQIELQKQYTVAGATLPYYLDPSIKLPGVDDMATATSPGWEDWDGDGNPGITGICSGTVNGRLFTAARDWVTLSGTAASASSTFRLEMDWDQEQNVLAFDGSPFLGSTAVRAADSRLHFAEFARLTPEQVSGEDDQLCARLVGLAPTLTPEAAGM